MQKPLRRTWLGVRFTYIKPQGSYGRWVSEDGIELVCGNAFRSNLSDHWCLWYEGTSRCSGGSATEVLRGFLEVR